MIVAGVDGCRAGWAAILFPLGEPLLAALKVVNRLEDLFTLAEPPASVAIDMPIGLPAQTGPGGRRAEIQVRALIGPRRASVFAIPSRDAVYAADYASARALALASSVPPRSIAKQAFNLFPKIRELDLLLQSRPDLRGKLFECHPEASFRIMLGAGLPYGKKTPQGASLRLELLAANGFAPTLLQSRLPRHAAADDVLDACAAAWTAARIAEGKALRFPEVLETDSTGLEMAIRA